jgi:hypothetical protein
MARYCIDTNVLIEAKNGPYAFDIVPGFWNWIEDMVRTGVLYSTLTVYQELTEGDDELAKWIRDRKGPPFFIEPSDAVQEAFRDVAQYVNDHFKQAHVETFLSGADPWVIAQARVDATTIVTREAAVNPTSKKVKIPNVSRVFDVRCIDTFAMLREAGASFR